MSSRPRVASRSGVASLALLPMAVTVLVVYLGSMLWTLAVSFTSSRTFPAADFVGLEQYQRLFDNERWSQALHNLALYGVLFIVACLLIGTLLAIFMDQKVRAEGVLRTIFLYPYAMSFVATGLVWQWVMNPEAGLQQAVRQWGFASFSFDWIVDPDRVIYTIVIAAVWQASGLVMALVLAGLRGVDEEIWKAARVEGIPRWRVYLQIVLPMLGPTLLTTFVLLFAGVVKVFDSVVAMTQGGPGTASDVPAKFIMDHLFGRANIALASAGSVLLLCSVVAIVAPVLYVRGSARRRRGVTR
ncbi:MAG TPA: sugar ABC transporter permease [Rubrivivax sp.]|nr:sugar ABC transporter permease [Rubrivivax sp.]